MNKLVMILVYTSMLLTSSGALAADRPQKQVVYLDDQAGVVTGWYRTENTTAQGSTGIGIRLHYNSRETRPVLEGLYQNGLIGVTDQADSSDLDLDDKTDRFIKLAWMSPMGKWGKQQPLMLFEVLGVAAPRLSITASDTAVGYEFEFKQYASE